LRYAKQKCLIFEKRSAAYRKIREQRSAENQAFLECIVQMSVTHNHQPVLFDAVMEGLAIQKSGIYIDATFGRGGHSLGILNCLGPDGFLMAMDKDPEAVNVGKQTSFNDPRFSIVHQSFSHIRQITEEMGWMGKVNGVLLDLGVSSPQLDDAERGFSFSKDGPLDMRMNTTQPLNAANWINQADQEEIYRVIRDYGEERYAGRIATAIVKARQIEPIIRTDQLSKIVSSARPRSDEKKHPATRTFQGIRIFINDELAELTKVLPECEAVLAAGGRLCVISFHSLEDRLVKQFIQKEARGDDYPKGIPVLASAIKPRLKKISALIRADEEEVEHNPRARSARLRIAEKIG
jgi:16S rRNA (cytosine1402-N4)-methyltransferase